MLIFARGPFVCFTRYMQALSSEIVCIENKRSVGPVSLQSANWTELEEFTAARSSRAHCRIPTFSIRTFRILACRFQQTKGNSVKACDCVTLQDTLAIVWGLDGPYLHISPPSEFRNSNLLESAVLLPELDAMRARAECKGKNDEIVPDHGRRGKGRGGGREGDDTGKGELHFNSRWQCVLCQG